jgi:nitrite reductase/ring-hydroxylating ferredoxin subunit
MLKKIGIGAVLAALVVIFAACAGPSPASEPVQGQEPTAAPNQEPASGQEPTVAPNQEPVPSQEPVLNPKPRPQGPIKGTWIEVEVDPDSQLVSIPVSELENNWNIHFRLQTNKDDITFMAYIFEGELYVRANVCPPCRSIGYSLDEGEGLLICDRCATLFNAGTGDGIEGACVDYPKASVPYGIVDGNVVLTGAELLAAYQDTLSPG